MSFRAALLVGLLAMMLTGIGVVSAQSSDNGNLAEEYAFKTHDDLLLEVHNLAPGFGGMFLSDDNAILHAWMLDTSQSETAKEALEQVFGEWITEGREFQAIQGQYSIGQLHEWYSRKRDAVWAIPAVHMTDLDEGDNRLWIGVDDLGAKGEIEQALVSLDIPIEAVAIVEKPRLQRTVQQLQSARKLTDRAAGDKMVGGYSLQGYGIQRCTLGFNADRAGVAGFVTSGHCTQDFRTYTGGVQNTNFYQPSRIVNPTAIGQEKTDPLMSSNLAGCARGHICRYSDAAFIEYSSGASRTLGVIAKPLAYKGLTVSSSQSYRIVKDVTSLVDDEVVYKVGRTTGMTYGTISSTCTNVGYIVSGTGFPSEAIEAKLLCQGGVSGLAESGDSGSPVFRVTNSPSQNDVELLGLIQGNAGSQAFYFSKAKHIFFELQRDPDNLTDTWDTCASSFNC